MDQTIHLMNFFFYLFKKFGAKCFFCNIGVHEEISCFVFFGFFCSYTFLASQQWAFD